MYFNCDIGDQVENTEKFVVTPYNVANAIKGIKHPRVVLECRHGTQTHETVADPYSSEINQEYVPIINCAKCVHDSYMET